MAKKKHPQISVSQEENAQAQQVLGHYHQIVNHLHESKDQQQAETALTEINNLPEGAQIALLKELSKENHIDAADLLIALNELSQLKSVRKEARRSLIRLEAAKIYPNWQPPIERTPAISAVQLMTNPPRFWKGLVTNTFVTSYAQLLLCWEQGDGYREVRIVGFLLDFLHDGVQEFFTTVESKRSFDDLIAEMTATGITMKSCSLAEGRRLLLDALAVNKKHHTQPHEDYRLNLSLVKQLILEAPDLDEESEESINPHGLNPLNVVVAFVENWVKGNYGLAHDLLSKDSSLRAGLSRDEWIARRETWAEQAEPDRFQPGILYEREQPKSKLWLPTFSARHAVSHKEVETSWSIELNKTPLSDTLPELPKASATYEETGQSWFWSSYTLIQEDGEWRIQSMTDEGTKAQNLSIEELQQAIQKQDRSLEEFAKKHPAAKMKQIKTEDAQGYVAEISRNILQATYYIDALIKKLPLDPSNYEQAAARMVLLQDYERALVYLTPRARRFPERRAQFLKAVAEAQRELSNQYFDEEDEERAERFEKLAEQSLQESLAIESSFEAHISLAELLIEDDERLDEAEEHLLQAKDLALGSQQEAHVELHLGEIASKREEYKQALSHFQRVVDLEPDLADSWEDLAVAHKDLGNVEEAEVSYKRAIELAPENEEYYLTLASFYLEQDQLPKAIDLLEEGIDANPDSATLLTYLAGLYVQSGDHRLAETFLSKAERIDPENEAVLLGRQVLNLSKVMQPEHTHTTPKLSKPSKRKKRR